MAHDATRLEAIPAITLSLVQGHCVGGAPPGAVPDLGIALTTLLLDLKMELGIPLGWGGVPAP